MKLPYDKYAMELRKLERMQEAVGGAAPGPQGTVSAIAGGPGSSEPPEHMSMGGFAPSGGMGGGAMGGGMVGIGDDDDGCTMPGGASAVPLYEVDGPELPTKGSTKKRIIAKQQDEDE